MEHLTFDEAVKVFTLFCKSMGLASRTLETYRVCTQRPTEVPGGDIRSA